LKEEVWLAYCSILAMCNQLKALKRSKADDACVSMETSLNDTSFQFKVSCRVVKYYIVT
jgi:hypothetical protein